MQATILPPIDPVAQAESDHRIASNLALRASQVELDAQIVASTGHAEVLQNTRRRIYAVANIHRRLYHAPDDEFLDLSDYRNDLGDNLRTVCRDAGRRQSLTVVADAIHLKAELAVTIGTLVAARVGNACAHAYARDQAGEVRIGFRVTRTGWQLMVEDDRLGGAQAPPRSAASMGTLLIDATATRLGASYVWQYKMPGTRFTLWKDMPAVPIVGSGAMFRKRRAAGPCI